MRLGLIGLGRIGAFHAQTLTGLDAVSELLVTDAVPARTAEVADQVGATAVDSVSKLMASGLDGLVIAAGTAAHPDCIVAAVEAGIPVFCEKPVSGSIESSAAVLAKIAGSSTPVHIGYQRRFDPAFVAVRHAVATGELGWLHTIRSTTMDPTPPPREYVATSGGLFRDCAVHDFDAVRWVSGQEVVEVYATGSNQGEPWFTEVGDVDTSAVILTLSSGTMGVVSNTRYNLRGYDVRLEVHGSLDAMAAGLEPQLPLRSAEPGVEFPDGPPHAAFMYRFTQAYRDELEAFTQVVAGELESPCDLTDALEAEWTAQACTISLREHRPVTLAEVREQVGA